MTITINNTPLATHLNRTQVEDARIYLQGRLQQIHTQYGVEVLPFTRIEVSPEGAFDMQRENDPCSVQLDRIQELARLMEELLPTMEKHNLWVAIQRYPDGHYTYCAFFDDARN